jgi:hypothetical protein
MAYKKVPVRQLGVIYYFFFLFFVGVGSKNRDGKRSEDPDQGSEMNIPVPQHWPEYQHSIGVAPRLRILICLVHHPGIF